MTISAPIIILLLLPVPPCRLQVTNKDDGGESSWTAFRRALGVTWPHLTYLAAFAAGFTLFIVKAASGIYRWAGGWAPGGWTAGWGILCRLP